MRRIDKKLNMQKVNLLAEQRYLESKGLLSEAILPLSDGKFAFAEDEEDLPTNDTDELIEKDENNEVVLKNVDEIK